ncbi:SUZ domain-containing protein 1 [Anolis carolinensis]|uniref:SUZ domain-containing protein 1 n=1 Tax=Anolis carolinensis TaxID=28377 RepID=UPI002F2B6161
MRAGSLGEAAHALVRARERGASAAARDGRERRGRPRAHAPRAGWRRGLTMEDEEVAESWEEAADSGEIDRRLEKKLKISQKESRKPRSPPKAPPVVLQDEGLPLAGPPPQIRILKRPTSNGVLGSPHAASRPAFPVKSLAQREAEYAEARKRILGSASPEEEDDEDGEQQQRGPDKPLLDRPPRISHPDEARPASNVIRQPLGPDGSQGFRQRR